MEDGLEVLQETPVPPPPSPAHLFFHSPNGRGLLHHLRDYVARPMSNPNPNPNPEPSLLTLAFSP